MIRINPALDAGKLARQFRRESGRMQVRDFLAAEDAEWTYEQLADNKASASWECGVGLCAHSSIPPSYRPRYF